MIILSVLGLFIFKLNRSGVSVEEIKRIGDSTNSRCDDCVLFQEIKIARDILMLGKGLVFYKNTYI